MSALQVVNSLFSLFLTRDFIAVINRVCIWNALKYMASVHSIAQYFRDSWFNITIPSTSTCAKWFIHFGFSNSSFLWTSKCLILFNFIALVIAPNSTSYEVPNMAVFATLLTTNFFCPLYTSLCSQIFSLHVGPWFPNFFQFPEPLDFMLLTKEEHENLIFWAIIRNRIAVSRGIRDVIIGLQ